MTRILFLFLLGISTLNLHAQVGINTSDPDSSAALEIKSTDLGILIPRMTCEQKDEIADPALGLLVFDLCDSLFYYYEGSLWIPIIGKVNFVSNLVQNLVKGNTLDEAYDEGGGGNGRTIMADSGAVEIRGYKENDGLRIVDTEAVGTNTNNLVNLVYKGSDSAQKIQHASRGSGLEIANDTTLTAGKSTLILDQNSPSGTFRDLDNGRAMHAQTHNARNNKPVIEGANLGVGHGVLGVSGIDNYNAPFAFRLLPIAGVAGYSGTSGPQLGSDGYSGSIDPGLGIPVQRARVGVAGLSYRSHGVLGGTNSGGKYNSSDPDSITAAVKGTGQFFPTVSGNVTTFDLFAVAGVTLENGVGVLGIGGGHGVVGLSGTREDASMAGVWGNTRDMDWATTKNTYSLVNSTSSKGKVGVLGTSRDRVGIWGESLARTGIVATSGTQFSEGFVPASSKIGIYATTDGGTAGVFVAEPDTSGDLSATMTVELGIDEGNAMLVTADTSADETVIVIDNKGKEDALVINMDFPALGGRNNEQKAAISINHASDTTSAVQITHKGGDSHGIFVRNESNNAGIFSSDRDSIGIIGTTDEGTAGVQGLATHGDPNATGLHGVGGGHRDSAAALELTTGVVTVSGPEEKRTAGRVSEVNPTPGFPLFGWSAITSGSASPSCPTCGPPAGCHTHPIGIYKDYMVSNDLLIPSRSMVFLQASALPNDGVAPLLSGSPPGYEGISAHVIDIMPGGMTVRVTIMTGTLDSPECAIPPFNAPLAVAPTAVACDFFIINTPVPE